MRARQLSRWTAGLVAVATVGTSTACGNAQEAPRPRHPNGTDQPARAAAEEAAAEKAALAAYSGYLAASRTASRRSDPQEPALTRFLADPLLTRVRFSLRQARQNGAVSAGTLRSEGPTVISMDLDATPPTVEIQDCVDASNYRLVYLADDKVVPGTRGSRHLATATAARYPDGRWRISAGAAHQDQPC